MSTSAGPRRSPVLPMLAAVFLVALAVRAAAPETIVFAPDQQRDITRGRAILAGAAPTAGPNIGGVLALNLGPLYYYVVAAGLVPRDRPVDVLLLLAVLNAAGVAGFAWVVRRGFGTRTAFGIGLVLALYPLAILNARAISNPVLTLPAMIPFIAGLQRWIAERRPGGLGLALVGAALMVQTHASTCFLLPLLLLGLFARAPILGRGCLIGAAVAAALTLPWLVPQIERLVSDPALLDRLVERVNLAPTPAVATVGLAAKLGWVALPELLLGRLVAHGSPAWRAILEIAGIALGVLAALGAIRLLTLRQLDAWIRAALLGAVLLPAAAISLMPSAFLHYLEPMVAFRVLLVGLGAFGWAGKPGRGIAGAVAPAVVLTVVLAGVLATAVGVGVTHLAVDVIHAGRSGLLLRDRDYVNFYRVKRGDSQPTGVPTMKTLRRVGRVLAVDIGAAPRSLFTRGRGPWWISFISDKGFWMREAERFGGVPAAPPNAESPVLIRHRDDPFPSPARAQRIAGRRVGAFEAFALESALDRNTLAFHLPDHNPRGVWMPCSGAVKGPVLQGLPCREAWFRMAVQVPDPAPAAIVFVIQTPGARRWKSVRIDNAALALSGRKRYQGDRVVEAARWDAPTPGTHLLELRSTRAEKSRTSVSLDLIDIWIAVDGRPED